MNTTIKILVTLVALLLILVLFPYPHTTGPTEVGVVTVKWSPFFKRGVEDVVRDPGGTYFFSPIFNDWHTFDTRLQNVEMTIDPKRGDRAHRDDLLFKTIDGNDISLDVIISYRIDPQKAPQILQFVAGSDAELKDNVIRTVARSRTRDVFGEMTTEQFYVADKRNEKSEQVKAILNEILQPYGVIVERVSTKDYRFNEAYQDAVEAR